METAVFAAEAPAGASYPAPQTVAPQAGSANVSSGESDQNETSRH